MSRSDLNSSRWLDAHSDRSAGLKTLPNNMVLADVAGDADHRLVLADVKLEKDVRSRLKVYKGTLLTTDQTLPDIPSAVISFYADNLEPKIPAIGVACGMDLLLYKNNKPYFKFTVPSLPVVPLEEDVWIKLAEYRNYDLNRLVDGLKGLPFSSLSSRSQQLISLKPEEYPAYIEKYKDRELRKHSPITCATTLNRSNPEWNAVAFPVVATESGQVFILDPQTLSVLHQATVSTSAAIPSIIKAVGLYDVEFRIVVATREGHVCLIRRDWLEGRNLFQTTHFIVDMTVIPGDHFVAVATTNKTLSMYTKRGNKLWSLEMRNQISCICLIPLKHLSTSLLAVAMVGGAIQLYQGRQYIDQVVAADTPSSITFGQMGQEEHVLIIITVNGVLDFKILKRTADFNLSQTENTAAPALQSKPLPLPKRSKLFLEQSARERQNAIDIGNSIAMAFIKRVTFIVIDIFIVIQIPNLIVAFMITLKCTSTFNKTSSGYVCRLQEPSSKVSPTNQGSATKKEMVKLSAQVLGLGPKFTLILSLENMHGDKPLMDLSIVFHCKPTIYKLSSYFIQVPLLPPSLTYKAEIKVEEIAYDENKNVQGVAMATNQNIKVFCIRKEQVQPLLAATINMPPTDLAVPLL